MLRVGPLNGPARARWERGQIDYECRRSSILEHRHRIQDRGEHADFRRWMIDRLRETRRIIPR